ncbi:serine/threonine-protein kinase [Nocardiopsis potens]|uniref:hypothetical protein n=1 Tax=Nocardiopsis potens TaxID=1246458 RepID=UPI0003454C2F|nr:hypothetical protein [Nocardiopsis potens]
MADDSPTEDRLPDAPETGPESAAAELLRVDGAAREEYEDLADDLNGFIYDYPTGDPFPTIDWLAGCTESAARSGSAIVLPLLGLAASTPYAVWRSDSRRLIREIREALGAAADRLAPVACGHECPAYPAETGPDDLTNWIEQILDPEEYGAAAPETGEWAEEVRVWLCAANLRRLAAEHADFMDDALAEDGPVAAEGLGIHSPELKDLPDLHFHNQVYWKGRVVRRQGAFHADSLYWGLSKLAAGGFASDDPESDPRTELLWCARDLREHGGGSADSAAQVLLLSACHRTALSDETPERVLREELIEALSEAHRARADATCAHPGHPLAEAMGPLDRVATAVRSWRPDFTHKWLEVPPPVDAAAAEQALCPVFLRGEALSVLTALRADLARRAPLPSGPGGLDGRYLDAGGALRIDVLGRDVRFHRTSAAPEGTPAVWCARRLAGPSAPEQGTPEYAALVLSVAHAARHPLWYTEVPGAAEEFARALTPVAEAAPPLAPRFAALSRPQVASAIPFLRDDRASHPLIDRFNAEEWSDPALLAAFAHLALTEPAT